MEHLTSSLQITLSQFSDKGPKDENQDTLGARIPEGALLVSKGIALAIADGVSSSQSAKQASQTAVTSFLTDYYATPDTWSTEHSAKTVIHALNRFLWGQGRNSVREEGQLTTFTSCIFKGDLAFIFHVGDTRAYRFRQNTLEQLTTDHCQRLDKDTYYLSRVLGADLALEIEVITTDLQQGDIFILSSDGIHDAVPHHVLHQSLMQQRDPQNLTDTLIKKSKELLTQDNVSIQVARIDSVGNASQQDAIKMLSRLPFPPFLTAGQNIDGYHIEKILHESERSQVFLVVDQNGRRLVMKTPSINYEDDPAYIERFVMESWIGSRIYNRNVVRVIPPQVEPKYLYYLTEYIAGPRLTQLIKERAPMPIPDAVELLEILVKAVRAFHRKDTLHQDIKPDNIVVSTHGPTLLDFGSCWVAGVHELKAPFDRDKILGTLDYSAPEYRFAGKVNQRSDQFSLAVVFYEMLTGAKPYGDQYAEAMDLKAFQRLHYIPARKLNPLVPYWMDKALEKALSIHTLSRYNALSEWLIDLKRPNPAWQTPQELPLIERNPLIFWKLLCTFGWGAFFVTLYFLLGQ
ncbi:Serine/threonine-protein kinase StkP [Thalassocella blandensis]|nr:Serine/threonine-protein kinase StkP [Thalassocella blandensis]